jgi:very-short-patch-repair endonuclease
MRATRKHMERCTDAVIASIAVRQHGIVTRWQLIDAGVSRHSIDRRLRSGRLIAVHAGVYRVGPIAGPLAREMAATLACGEAAASHLSAASLLKLLAPQSSIEPVDVIVRGGRHRGRRSGIRAHRSGLQADEITWVDNVPVTDVARTLIDLSGMVGDRDLERAFAAAERLDSDVGDRVAALLERYARRAGTRRLRGLLDRRRLLHFTRSEAEERFLEIVRSGGLPLPRTNVLVHGFEVDCYWPSDRLVVEIDGYAFHGAALSFIRDRRRDSALAAAGIGVLRLSWQQLTKERDRTLVQLAQTLAHAQTQGGLRPGA